LEFRIQKMRSRIPNFEFQIPNSEASSLANREAATAVTPLVRTVEGGWLCTRS
jgi:hypothetical protein